MQKYMVMLVIISWHMCFFSRKPCGPGVSSSARGATWAQGHGHGHGHVSCASCNTRTPGTTGSMCCVLQWRHLLTFQPKASSDDPNTYSYHTWLLTTLTRILNSFQVPFLGLFWIVGVPCQAPPAHLGSRQGWAVISDPHSWQAESVQNRLQPRSCVPRISEGWYQHLRIQETWDQQAALQPSSCDRKMPNALPGNTVSWCLGWDAVYTPTLCSPRMLQRWE